MENIDNTTNKVKVRLSWGGNVDLDLSAFLLDDNGLAPTDDHLVFYNSQCRTEPYDMTVHGNRDRWIASTRPVSPCGGVVGAIDAEGADEKDSCEELSIDFAKLDSNISSIMLCVTTCATDNRQPLIAAAKRPALAVHNDQGDTIAHLDLLTLPQDTTSVEALSFVRNTHGQWELSVAPISHTGGLGALIDLYI